MEHVGIVVEDLPAAVDFFVELGMELRGEGSVGGEWVDRIVGLEGVECDTAMLRTPDGNGRIELVKFDSPPADLADRGAPANALGLRHLAFEVEDIEGAIARLRPHGAELVGEVVSYRDVYLLCYLRGPAGMIIELAQKLG